MGDAQTTLSALLPLLEQKGDRSWQEGIEADVVRWWELIEKRATLDGEPLTPQRAFFELNQRLPDESIITADSGTAASWYAGTSRCGEG